MLTYGSIVICPTSHEVYSPLLKKQLETSSCEPNIIITRLIELISDDLVGANNGALYIYRYRYNMYI